MRVKKAEYVDDYMVRMLFSDGITKVVDFKPFLKDAKNLFLPLLDMEYFKGFSVDDTTICWPNEVDFCPDVLYEVGQDTKEKLALNVELRKQSTSKTAQIRHRASALEKRSFKKSKN